MLHLLILILLFRSNYASDIQLGNNCYTLSNNICPLGELDDYITNKTVMMLNYTQQIENILNNSDHNSQIYELILKIKNINDGLLQIYNTTAMCQTSVSSKIMIHYNLLILMIVSIIFFL